MDNPTGYTIGPALAASATAFTKTAGLLVISPASGTMTVTSNGQPIALTFTAAFTGVLPLRVTALTALGGSAVVFPLYI